MTENRFFLHLLNYLSEYCTLKKMRRRTEISSISFILPAVYVCVSLYTVNFLKRVFYA